MTSGMGSRARVTTGRTRRCDARVSLYRVGALSGNRREARAFERSDTNLPRPCCDHAGHPRGARRPLRDALEAWSQPQFAAWRGTERRAACSRPRGARSLRRLAGGMTSFSPRARARRSRSPRGGRSIAGPGPWRDRTCDRAVRDGRRGRTVIPVDAQRTDRRAGARRDAGAGAGAGRHPARQQ